MPKIRIDGVDYDTDQLSKAAKAQLSSLRLVDQKIAAAEQELEIFKAARNFYARALKSELSKTK